MIGRIAIFTDDPGWHGKKLSRAFAARGYQAVNLSLSECRVDLERGIAGLVLPGFEERLPDGGHRPEAEEAGGDRADTERDEAPQGRHAIALRPLLVRDDHRGRAGVEAGRIARRDGAFRSEGRL